MPDQSKKDNPGSQKNLAQWDRALRTVLGLILLALWGDRGFSNWWMPIIGVALLVNAAMGKCGLYKIFGISTCPVKLKAPDKAGKPSGTT